MALHVMDEANHCLGCKVPRCQQGCPIHTNIPEVIRLLKANKLDEAGRMLFENNPLTTVCSLVCNHENQCEGHCVRGIKGAPVHFSVIENYISSTYASQMTQGPAPSNGKKAAIIGSGPAGLTIAVILARYGYDVTIFESHDKIGGVLRYGIPEFRLPKTVLDDFEYRHLRLKGIKVRPNTDVGKALKIEDLFRDGYKAIFIGTGVWRPNTLHIKGESLGNVHYAINYLQNPDVYHLGNRVIVIGAGNAAMDVARTAIRHGTRHLECFSLSSHITASEYEASYAKLEGGRGIAVLGAAFQADLIQGRKCGLGCGEKGGEYHQYYQRYPERHTAIVHKKGNHTQLSVLNLVLFARCIFIVLQPCQAGFSVYKNVLSIVAISTMKSTSMLFSIITYSAHGCKRLGCTPCTKPVNFNAEPMRCRHNPPSGCCPRHNRP